MELPKIVVIRTDDNVKKWIWQELQNGKLRQGWGIPELQLMENDRRIVGLDVWKERYKNSSKVYWNYDPEDHEAVKRYWILYPMVELRSGDIIVVPKIPTYNTFLITTVTNGYEFDQRPSQDRSGFDDYRHIIHIDSSFLKIFNYSSSLDTRTVSKKMRAYQSAVNKVFNEEFIEAILSLFDMEGDVSIKGISDLFGEIKKPLLKDILRQIRKLKFNDLEDLVKEIFRNVGYDILHTHKFDKKGGDADIIFTHALPLLSEFEGMDLKLYVQVKLKDGIDQYDIDGVEQLIKISEGDVSVSSVKILASTADGFTDACKIKAKENNVLLISGEDLAGLILRYTESSI